MREAGFVPFAAAALVAQHTYGEIQVGRPSAADLAEDRAFAARAAAKLAKGHLARFPPLETVLTAQAAHAANSVR